ncbi:type IV pili methyl-accepting chemotaxis transducer N-terminal domain-containing protein [Aquabacterium sp. A7-Y]|uniref:type IV pili methyl-accepting chemotaxis transducer N-terminal domain-containing protein n=1 Tax=Aquabacterium sp. A7-Y TaxID=1349605 RepID=UPI00223E79A8|nr:type IV pili methyl-accepting chemotaxis transducer N-terminal domain-containing protein [Aquabacterium sp. A7-Y]MCW7538477.1 type IV pili methyl-accepting chemotaxis transducer N-terminal domain-containing protein [Aquabacterium sp. A7-Y]
MPTLSASSSSASASASASTPPLPVPGPASRDAAVPADTLAALINLAGRQRMLSQRLVLQALLASMGRELALAAAREALALFADSHTTLVHGKGRLPGAHFAEVREAYFGAAGGDGRIREFISLAEQTLQALESGASQSATLLQALIGSAGAVLPLLNQITQIYESESRRCAEHLKRQLLALMGDIKSVAKQARMVAFNAQVLAARSGDSGREFAVVAKELTQVTGEIDELAEVALRVSGD